MKPLLVDGNVEQAAARDGDSTGEVTVDPGDHTVSEAASGTTLLALYHTAISCRDEDGTGTEVAFGSGPGPLTVPVEAGDDIVCVITNTSIIPAECEALMPFDQSLSSPGTWRRLAVAPVAMMTAWDSTS